MYPQLSAFVQTHFDYAVKVRRHLHANPELSHQEKNTAAFIAAELRSMGMEVQENIGGYGVVGLLRASKQQAPCIALRADMDALPISEKNNCEYQSKTVGVMHACGHDVHSAVLLGAAKVLCEFRVALQCDVKFIFQPAEEKAPSGAAAMVAAGVLENVSSIFGLHVTPEMESGTLGFHAGAFMASADEIYLTVKGKGGHAANRTAIINPILIVAELLLELEKRNDEQTPVVLSFGKIMAAGTTNVVPSEVLIEGTLRCFDEQVRTLTQKQIDQIAQRITSAHGGNYKLYIPEGNPVLINHEVLTTKCVSLSQLLIGEANTLMVPRRMGSEDFAFYSHHVPASFVRLGTGNKAKGITAALHTPSFDIDEAAIAIGMKWFAAVALEGLQS